MGITSKISPDLEEIKREGNVNPAVYGDTLKEAMDKLKKLLS